jgi:Domain of unknown function (DUF3786)
MNEVDQSRISGIYAADGSHLQIDAVYWQDVARRDRTALCNYTFFEPVARDLLQFRFLNEAVRVDLSNHSLLRRRQGVWRMDPDPLLTLATVVYLKNVRAVYPLGQDIVGVGDLKEGHFFAGPHELRTAALLSRFGNDPQGFFRAGTALNGRRMPMADAAFELLPFPRVPLYFLLWAGDDEFQPRLRVLFDRPIEIFLPADAIWALVNRVVQYLASA